MGWKINELADQSLVQTAEKCIKLLPKVDFFGA